MPRDQEQLLYHLSLPPYKCVYYSSLYVQGHRGERKGGTSQTPAAVCIVTPNPNDADAQRRNDSQCMHMFWMRIRYVSTICVLSISSIHVDFLSICVVESAAWDYSYMSAAFTNAPS